MINTIHIPERRHPMNKFNSIFGQILQIFSKREFYEAVMETEAEKRTKGFTCWDQFVAMIFCQLGQAHSLREICGGLATCLGKLKHLGINDALAVPPYHMRMNTDRGSYMKSCFTGSWIDVSHWHQESINSGSRISSIASMQPSLNYA
jgi:hypothetical protein